MSLSPVIGTDVLETANGDVAPISSENGPHDPTSVKCGGSRVPCPGEGSEDTDNHVEVENKVYDGKGCFDSETLNNGRTSSLSLRSSDEPDASLPAATCTGDSEDSESGSKDTDIHEASNTVGPPGAALLWEPAQRAQRSQRAQRAHFKELPPREGPATSDRQPRETDTDSRDEEEDGEKEKQDEEEDEKNEKKWIHQRAGGRKRVESSRHYSSSAPGPSTSSSSSTPPPLLPSDDLPCPPHVMAQVWVRNVRGCRTARAWMKSANRVEVVWGAEGASQRADGPPSPRLWS
ncbi:hypothetical protein F7725_000426 [Dissostichus mawsoni]|uniref:Uncharacterized protein n=1 Tax=Dissostichus mawsoni TaxID=36200 RepID=A0A7J5ZGA4_DISMA|nr:hypothetical protein F7725_000426 [Dissostichus mawsoni]